jgi:hypothetical protein
VKTEIIDFFAEKRVFYKVDFTINLKTEQSHLQIPVAGARWANCKFLRKNGQ